MHITRMKLLLHIHCISFERKKIFAIVKNRKIEATLNQQPCFENERKNTTALKNKSALALAIVEYVYILPSPTLR